jgi:hypothetical protein
LQFGNLNLDTLKVGGSGHTFLSNSNKNANSKKLFSQGSISISVDEFVKLTNFIPNYIKIDVDGNEDSVIKWMLKTLKNDQLKSILIEIDENNRSHKDCVDLILCNNFKILNVADREIKFKTEYDPAIYNVGSDEVIVDDTISWKDVHVGQLWWNISRSKWVNYNQGDLSYKVSNWGKLALGSTIQVCEWVESNLLPSEWEELADTTEGLAQGISGQPLYPNDENYTIKELFNPVTGELTNTLYYYWVQNKNTLPNVKIGR